MYVSDYINLLVSGEIKPLGVSNIGGEYRDETQEDNLQTLIRFIDLANKTLHEKFALLQREVMLQLVESNRPITLPTDFIYPINAATEDGVEVIFNNEKKIFVDEVDQGFSLMFPEPFVCLPKGAKADGTFDVSMVYVATPATIYDVKDNIPLTSAFTQAVLDYVAYRAYIGVDGHMEQTNNTYYLRFLSDCKSMRESGLFVTDNLDTNTKLEERGFV